MVELARRKVPLTVCPLSNLRLCVVGDMTAHPLKAMIDRGLVVTVNSDDPAYFGGYMNDNYYAVRQALGLSDDELAMIARNRSEEHTSELQSLMRISYAVFCLKKKKKKHIHITNSSTINKTIDRHTYP